MVKFFVAIFYFLLVNIILSMWCFSSSIDLRHLSYFLCIALSLPLPSSTSSSLCSVILTLSSSPPPPPPPPRSYPTLLCHLHPPALSSPLALSLSPCSVIVPLLCHHPLLCHCPPVLSSSPCSVITPCSVIVPLFCHRPPALSSPLALSLSPCSVIVPLLCHHPLLCHCPPVLSSSPCSVITPCSVIVPLLCHHPLCSVMIPSSVITPLLCHHHLPCSVMVPLLCHPPPPPPPPTFCHSPALSSSVCSVMNNKHLERWPLSIISAILLSPFYRVRESIWSTVKLSSVLKTDKGERTRWGLLVLICRRAGVEVLQHRSRLGTKHAIRRLLGMRNMSFQFSLHTSESDSHAHVDIMNSRLVAVCESACGFKHGASYKRFQHFVKVSFCLPILILNSL